MPYDILSPDGIAIDFSDTYKTKEEGIKAFEVWKKRYEKQGYYSSNDYGRIPLYELADYCSWVELEEEES